MVRPDLFVLDGIARVVVFAFCVVAGVAVLSAVTAGALLVLSRRRATATALREAIEPVDDQLDDAATRGGAPC